MSWFIELLINEQKVYDKKIYKDDYKYAFFATVNWMKALSSIISKKSNLFDDYEKKLNKKIKKYYKNEKDISILFNNIIMSFHYKKILISL